MIEEVDSDGDAAVMFEGETAALRARRLAVRRIPAGDRACCAGGLEKPSPAPPRGISGAGFAFFRRSTQGRAQLRRCGQVNPAAERASEFGRVP